ncbi:fork head domain-containing protein [Cokeromyces recurvatus]|uniref:fork head domain-containing protein n=1 Tax=Cokeromyces recurvatus TaxID=90255 RepID=UPI00221E8FE2|nr:fork head domain-containing protein [Cokeromyces recurvatus]KAI7908206.1 fork head domain-containing protein [Cokeromyces recurvatus]
MPDKNQLTQMSQFSIIRESPGETYHPTPSQSNANKKQRPAELKFKIEPIGIQPEDDDDLETCPSRTRSNWPHQIIPWWKPTERDEKPPYSYATLIAHAILTSKDGRLTLSDIYKWISEAYPYYKRGQKGWQNSIRHNLSLNKKWFVKVDRRPTQAHPGKGGYWTLQVNMEKIFVDNLCQAGGHSRRHHDMGMYNSSQYNRSSSHTESDENKMRGTMENMCPNIHITRPEDYEVKKMKTTISAPRIRNMSAQEKKNAQLQISSSSTDTTATATATATATTTIAAPKTDPKNFIIRFNPLDPVSKRRRPSPKSNKRRNSVEPGSSTSEDDDSAVEVDSYPAKKRKTTTTTTTTPTMDTLYNTATNSNLIRPSDVIGAISTNHHEVMLGLDQSNDFWMYDEPEHCSSGKMLLTSEYPLLFDVEAQNILHGLQSVATPLIPQLPTVQQQAVHTVSHHPDMKTIDLQAFPLEKNIHYPSNTFSLDDFSDPNSHLFVSDLMSYNLEQYIDFGAKMSEPVIATTNPPSDLLYENGENMLNSYWPEIPSCYINFDTSNTTYMPLH